MAAVPTSSLPDEQKQELLCTYAALILHDDRLDITEENLNKLISASGNSVEPYMPMLFARALDGKDVGALLTAVGCPGSGGGGGGGGDEGGAGGGDEKKEEKKEEPEEEEEEDEDLGFSLFD